MNDDSVQPQYCESCKHRYHDGRCRAYLGMKRRHINGGRYGATSTWSEAQHCKCVQRSPENLAFTSAAL